MSIPDQIPTIPATPARQWRTFVFDDDEGVRSLVERILLRRGHAVSTFPQASPCTHCRCDESSRCADIILSDMAMPGMNGLEFLASQRELDCHVAHLGLMSGSWTADTWERAQELNIQPFHKPLDLDMLQFWLAICEEPGQSERKLAPWYERDAQGAEPAEQDTDHDRR